MWRRTIIVLAASAVVACAGTQLSAAHQGSHRSGASPARARASSGMCGRVTKAPKYKHVIVIFMENNSYNTIYKSSSAPYINSLPAVCGLATNYHNISHPSLPNYMTATTGASGTAEIAPWLPDQPPSAANEWAMDNIFHQANVKGLKWKGYAESMPTACDKSDSGFYAARHNPAVYDTDLSNCGKNDVPLGTLSNSALLKDFSSTTRAPAFAWITPNLCNDMHGATGCPSNLIKTGDTWVKQWIPKITSTKTYRAGQTVIFLTWDEGEPGSDGESCATNTTDQSCHVVMIVIAPSVKPGKRSATLFNHYSTLKAAEDLLGLPELGAAKTAPNMLKAFNL